MKQKNDKCPRQNCKNKAITDTTYGVLPCEKCQEEDSKTVLPDAPEFYNISKQHRIQSQRDTHDGDIIQPWLEGKDQKPNPDFVRAYPDMAKTYFSDEQLEKM